MGKSPEVERWLDAKHEPPKKTMQRVREAILGADSRMVEYVKYGTACFGFEGDMATFVQVNRREVTLMFNRGARIQGAFPHLEGTGPSARFMHFAALADVDERATELGLIVASWCAMMAAGGPDAKTKTKTKTKTKAKAKPTIIKRVAKKT